jgi:hypothetical protein
MHRLWTAGTRPFGAGCVLVAATREVHLLSSWDDGIPEDVPFEHLYGVTWNPAVMAGHMAAIEGLAGAERIGVDALSPGFRRAAAGFAPEAELVPADDLLADLRRAKNPAEQAAVRTACAVAGAAVDAVVEAVTSGDALNRAELRSVGLEAAARAGGTVPTSGVRVELGPTTVTVDVGVLVDDWEGGLGRTVSLDGAPLGGRAEEQATALAAGCRAGATGNDLQAAGGEGDWLIRGVGMGFERPVVGPALGSDADLRIGDVLSVSVTGEGHHHRDVVAVTEESPGLLS